VLGQKGTIEGQRFSGLDLKRISVHCHHEAWTDPNGAKSVI
jgi:hypothetical protein